MNMMPATRSRPLILNVNVNASKRSVTTRSLRLDEMEVAEAKDDLDAVALVADIQPSLVLLDLGLSHANGLKVCQRIKAACADAVVIQISVPPNPSAEKISGVENGADCTLITPVEPLELIAVIRAMLRLRHAEAQVREARERYRIVLESAIDHAIFTCGLDGRVTSWNAGAQAILGYTPDEIIGEHCARIFIADDVVADVHTGEMRSAFDGISVHAERWHCRRDGTRFWSSGRMLALRDRGGAVAEYLKILCDRSAEKDAREALDALNAEVEERVAARTRELTEANEKLRAEMAERERASEQIRQVQKLESLGQLTGGIAHDFNNLLTAILGGLEVIRRRVDEPRSVRLIDSSISAAQRGAKLIAQLTAFARKQNLRAAHVSLNTLVMDMRELLEQTAGSSVGLDYDLADNLRPVMLDATQMRTVLLNLSINARDAMPDGGTLRIGTGNRCVTAAEADLPAGEYATLTIQDNGTGMTEAVMGRLFEPFFTTKGVGKGSGLGLAQVHGFVRQSGGTVRVCSATGEGTTVTILLPVAVATDEDDA